ncbi:Vegetative incompatibility protein HET-E-1-like protein 3 [Colletotrichum chlorophyti]|uniref:Vegetative incompatibility protein HET-E-1-like protein 3 n=1 Tax=Colletotrichum chlorophyti TaxID=708187 RepID=A0A1Q8S703_9PEZI|nr:Vegetative incompatibility protein HET-E-1-like protein 3 [Colletotrichum chlorophyti]
MRLISTSDLTRHSFPDNDIPPYSILSHTWGSEEVSHQQMLNIKDEVRSLEGYEKISACAEISRAMGYDYTWVDTCCIDKTSSAELSEAINSMFAWYQNSGVCLVYLEDFHWDGMSYVTRKHRWFTRGWTLQELIAPRHVEFYSASWTRFGDKRTDWRGLHRLTSIDPTVLRTGHTEGMSVAEKMRWAAHRTTTRIEDMAYCLLGIFGVNLPLIYGEGEKAFQRL